ncbi:MAG TPA: acetate uptake transporter [Candidatus Binataceae bacterium]|nr:acetate uptake transporter [Candidatus Binataceae bacterium]
MLRPGKDKGLANPLPLGLAALGSTAFLMGVASIFQPAAMAPYLTQALIFGGLLELLAGMWCFAYGDPLAATAFSFIGAFFGWWGLSAIPLLGAHAAAGTVGSTALVFLVAGVVIAYLWIASFYEFAAFNLVMLFLWIGLVLSAVAMLSGLEFLRMIGGIVTIACGVVAGYASFANLYNATSLSEVVPVGESEEVRARAERDELERIRRINPVGSRFERESAARQA